MPTVGPQYIDARSTTTSHPLGVWSNECIIAHTPHTSPGGDPRGVQYRMGIDHAPIGGINALSSTTPHTRGVGGCIVGSIASTTPSHSPGVKTPRGPIGGDAGGDRPTPTCSRHSPPSTPCHDGKPWA